MLVLREHGVWERAVICNLSEEGLGNYFLFQIAQSVFLLQECSGQLMSHNTYQNIVKNKGNIDYCVDVGSIPAVVPFSFCLPKCVPCVLRGIVSCYV